MPIKDANVVAQILFAETNDLTIDPTADAGAGLVEARAILAWMIGQSDNGQGFAPPRQPTAADYGIKVRLDAWQDCTAAATVRRMPMLIGGQSPDVAFFADHDPTAAPTLLNVPGWLSAHPQFDLVGSFLRNNQAQKLYISVAPAGIAAGRYPDGNPNVVQAIKSPPPGITNRFFGALAFAAIVGVLLGCVWYVSTLWTANGMSNAETAKGADSVALKKAKEAKAEAFQAAKAKAAIALMAADTAASAAVKPPIDPKLAQIAVDVRKLFVDDMVDVANQAPLRLQSSPVNLVGPWAMACVAVFGLFALVSYGLRGQILGFLIDERGRLSLARLQLVVWNILILSTYWIYAAWNLSVQHAGLMLAAEQVLPQLQLDLWLLLGIVFTSPLASSLILDSKSQQAQTVANLPASSITVPTQVDSQVVTNDGLVDARTNTHSWSFLDLFTGEYLGTRGAIDVSRLQQFIFTLLSVIVYAGLVWNELQSVDGQAFVHLPALGANAVGLLALSHTAYLAAKGIQK